MPNYEYKCPNCATVYELWQEVGADAPPCPECASTDVKKVFHPPRVHFKGSGFYLTDLRAEQAGKNAKPKDEAPKSEPEKSSASETKSEPSAAAKPESKPESKPEKPATPAKSS